MRTIAALLFSALLATTVVADPKTELKTAPGRNLKLQVTGDYKTILWDAGVADVDLIESETGRWAIFMSPTDGTFRVTAWAAKGDTPVRAADFIITVGKGGPGPNPNPGPGPNPGPDPAPAKAWLVVIEETADATATRSKFLTDDGLYQYLTSKGWKARVEDKDVKNKNGQTPADLAPYISRSAGKKLPYFFIVDQAGKIRVEGQLPPTPADLLSILKQVGQ